MFEFVKELGRLGREFGVLYVFEMGAVEEVLIDPSYLLNSKDSKPELPKHHHQAPDSVKPARLENPLFSLI